MLLEFMIKSYSHSFYSTLRARPVDVKPPTSASIWKTVSESWCKIRVNMSPFRQEDQGRNSRTKERFDNSYEWMFTDSSWNCGKGSHAHVPHDRLQSPSYQGDILFLWTLKSEHFWGQNLQNWKVSSSKKARKEGTAVCIVFLALEI